jgi:hypothetical protein
MQVVLLEIPEEFLEGGWYDLPYPTVVQNRKIREFGVIKAWYFMS